MKKLKRLFPSPSPPSLSDVEAVEVKIGTSLPEEYRQFLLEIGGGVPSSSCYSDGKGTDIYIQNMFMVGDADSPIDLASEIDANPASRGFSKNLVPIATANGGDYLLIHKKKGTIYLWEHETDTVAKVCNSWNDIINGLEEKFDD